MSQIIFLNFIFFAFSIFSSSFLCAKEKIQCQIASEVGILIDADSGEVLFQKNASKLCFPASITKIATALYALKVKRIELDTIISVRKEAIGTILPSQKKKNLYKSPAYWLEVGSNHISLKEGEKLSCRDLLYAMMLSSANDASNVLAQAMAEGSIDKFMKDLNRYLKTIGCTKTLFMNPHGLHHPKHQTCAKDMALIAREAMKMEEFRKIVSSSSYECKKTNCSPSRLFVQSNPLFKKGANYYKAAIGIKTGYTQDAGPTLVAAAKKNGKTLIAVIMRTKKRSIACQDVIKLFNSGFSS